MLDDSLDYDWELSEARFRRAFIIATSLQATVLSMLHLRAYAELTLIVSLFVLYVLFPELCFLVGLGYCSLWMLEIVIVVLTSLLRRYARILAEHEISAIASAERVWDGLRRETVAFSRCCAFFSGGFATTAKAMFAIYMICAIVGFGHEILAPLLLLIFLRGRKASCTRIMFRVRGCHRIVCSRITQMLALGNAE